MAKAILIAGLISIQAALIAGDSSNVNKDVAITNDAYIAGTELPNTLKAENTYCYLNDVAFEAEMEIEDWMYNIQNDNDDAYPEEEYKLEEWMCNIHNSFWNEIYETEEPELAIENWMTNPDEWLIAIYQIILSSK